MKASKLITMDIPTHDSSNPAPLFSHYEGQTNPQNAYIEMDLRDGKVRAMCNGEIGNAVPMHVYNGVIRRYPIRNDLTADQIIEVLSEIKGDLQFIYENSDTVFRNGNLYGNLSDEACNRDELLADPHEGSHGNDLEGKVIVNLAEWILASGDSSVYTPKETDNVNQFIKDFDLDDYFTNEPVGDVLAKIWLTDYENRDDFDGPGNMQPNMAKFIIDNGDCPDMFKHELQAIAESGSKPTPARSVNEPDF